MLEKGQTVNGRYEIAGPIAKGGTSCVYLVHDRHIGRGLAMKVIKRDAVGSFYFARSEIEALRRVRHPLIPVIWDAFYDLQNIYIVSEYVKGETLDKICRPRGLGRTKSLAVAGYICSALEYLHRMKKPMLYLDLKPENIIVDYEGLPHLIDFGIAGCLADHHIPVGTIGYSPPEQYDKDAQLDERADIFAFGMTYYSIRSGRIPDSDPQEALKNIRNSRTLNSFEKSFLARCCAMSREERYTDVNEVQKQIRYIRSIPQKIKKSIEITAISAGIIVSGYCGAVRVQKHIRENEAARELYEMTTDHMRDGEYTPEGIRIIKSAISSGALSGKSEQDFIFEVAMNAMFTEHDYRTALLYFSKLDPQAYPDVTDYITLCKMQRGFHYDRESAEVITGRLYASTAARKPSVQKYETLIFISGCYENYETDEVEGLSKALTVIDTVKQELVSLDGKELSLTKDGYERIRTRLDEMLSAKKARLKVIKEENRERNNEKER